MTTLKKPRSLWWERVYNNKQQGGNKMKTTIALLTMALMCLPMNTYAENNAPSENGALFTAVTTIGGLVGQGALRMFSGGPDGVSSSVITAAAILTAYSNLPHVKRGHREKIASEMGLSNPSELSDNVLLELVRDNDNKAFYKERWEESLNIAKPTNGGGLRARILALQQ
jgi:hypothetical protein